MTGGHLTIAIAIGGTLVLLCLLVLCLCKAAALADREQQSSDDQPHGDIPHIPFTRANFPGAHSAPGVHTPLTGGSFFDHSFHARTSISEEQQDHVR